MSIQVQYEDDTFWLSQKRMAELFGIEVPTIYDHLKERYIKAVNWQKRQLLEKIE